MSARYSVIRIDSPTGALIVDVLADGAIVFGEGVTPSQAAAEFWAALEPLVRASFGQRIAKTETENARLRAALLEAVEKFAEVQKLALSVQAALR